MKVTVYSTPNCAQCSMTKKTLERFGVGYDAIDVTQNPEALELITSMGYTAAPVVIATHNDITESWSGFRIGKLQHLKTLIDS